MFKKTLLAALVSGVMISGVQAAEIQPNGYLFGNVGEADYDFGSAFNGLPGSLDDTDTAYKVGAGVQLNRYIGVELQYVNLGEAIYKAPGSKSVGEADGYGANLVATLPLDRFKLYGKLGYHKLDIQWDGNSEEDSIASYAIGATYALTPTFEIVAEYERYDDVADEFDEDVDIDLASIGLRYNF